MEGENLNKTGTTKIEDPTTVPGLFVPKQKRSKKAMEKVLFAFHRELKKRSFTEIGMAEIAQISGVAIGAIYFRFSSKEHLLVALSEKIFQEEIKPSFPLYFHPVYKKGTDLNEFLLAYYKTVGKIFSSYHFLLRPLATIGRETKNKQITTFRENINQGIQEKLITTILSLAREKNSRVSRRSVENLIICAGASLREVFLYGHPITNEGKTRKESFLVDLVRDLSRNLLHK